jgi:hypothetical protein
MFTKSGEWLGWLTASLENPGDLKAHAKEETLWHLSRCGAEGAADLHAALDAENSELSQELARDHAPSSIARLMRRQEVTQGASQAFELVKNRRDGAVWECCLRCQRALACRIAAPQTNRALRSDRPPFLSMRCATNSSQAMQAAAKTR